MLVIARKIGEAIRIGPDIVIRISDIHGKQVRLAISAPDSLTVARGELNMDLVGGRKGSAAGNRKLKPEGECGESQT